MEKQSELLQTRFFIPIGSRSCSVTLLNDLGYTKGWSACRHNHAETEVQFVLSGECAVLIQDVRVEIKAGDILLIAPQAYHAPVFPGPGPDFEKYSFLFSFPPSEKKGQSFETRESDAVAAAFQSIGTFRVAKDTFGGANLFKEVFRELKDRPSGYGIRTAAILAGLIVMLSRATVGKPGRSECLPPKTPDENRLAILESFFDYDYQFVRTQKRLAELLGVSCRQAGRILQKTYGQSFREKLLQTRMEAASDLLVNTGGSVGDIALHLGYEAEAGFYSKFEQYYGTTPAAYRRKMRREHNQHSPQPPKLHFEDISEDINGLTEN